MAIDPVTGSVILGGIQGVSRALSGGEERRQGRHNRYMDRRDANIQDLDRRAQYERRAARSGGSGHLLQQLAQRLGITMPEGAFGGSREAVPGAVGGASMPTDRNSAFGQSYPGPQRLPPPPPDRSRPGLGVTTGPQGLQPIQSPAASEMGGGGGQGGEMAELLKLYLSGGS